MRIAFITKYPPIQGGTSSRAYWLIRGLAKKGMKIKVITNSWETEKEYRIKLPIEYFEGYKPKNVEIFSTNPFDNPKYIPYSNPYLAKLSSLSLDVVRDNDVDLIDTWYLLPYSIAGYINKTITGKKFIVRHAGSDMTRLLEYPYLTSLFAEVFRSADKIVTHQGMENKFKEFGVRSKQLHAINKWGVDISAFNPKAKPIDIVDKSSGYDKKKPTICYIGKAERDKGVFDLIDALGEIKNTDFNLLLVTSSNKEKLNERLRYRKLDKVTTYLDYVPPWIIPRVIKSATCVVAAEHDFPVPIHNPVLPREVMATGTCLAISTDLCKKMPYSMLTDEQAMIFDPRDKHSFVKILSSAMNDSKNTKRLGVAGRKFSENYEKFDEFVNENIRIYKEMIDNA